MNQKFIVFASLVLVSLSSGAQTFEGGGNVFETPFGMRSVLDIDNPSSIRRDENFNRTSVDAPGWGFSATAIGNLINVQTQGNNNTVVIHATQINNGTQNAELQANF